MKIFISILFTAIITILYSNQALAEIEIQMDTTTIKANTELPKIIYIIPWQETKRFKNKEQLLVIHSLFGDLFEPSMPVKSTQ